MPAQPSWFLRVESTKPEDAEVFRYLGGTKTILADQTYRETRYGLDANATDPEYRRYFAAVSQPDCLWPRAMRPES